MKVGKREDFLLGNIAPDAIHMRRNSTGRDKSITHLHCKDFSDPVRMKEDLHKFYRSEIDSDNSRRHRDFTRGYCSHLMTDFYWFSTIFKKFEQRLPKKISDDQIKASYYFDTDHLDSKIYHRIEMIPAIMDELSKAGGHSNQFLSEDEIESWKNRTLGWFSDNRFDPEVETKYLSYGEVLQFIEETTEAITESSS